MIQQATRLYFKIYSFLSPMKAGNQAFHLFQKTQRRPLRSVEQEFYDKARAFEIVHPVENINAYEMGPREGKLVILVHGWDGNAGNMGTIAESLAERGFRVVTLDFPAHGHSELTHTNIRDCSEALRALVYHLRGESFSIVAHSFGAVVASVALSGSRYKIDNFIMLSAPSQLTTFFKEFATWIGLSNAAYDELLRLSASILNSPVSWVTLTGKLSTIDVNNVAVIHDKFDKRVPFLNAEDISTISGAKLYPMEHAGHYRILRNEQVLEIVAQEMNATTAKEFDVFQRRDLQVAV